jgi:hypothetical protein
MRWKPIGFVLFIVLLGPSCQAAKGNQGPLAGEWSVSLNLNHQTNGVIVFHGAIPCYCVESGELPAQAEVGRAYLGLTARGQSPRKTTDEHFAVGEDADHYEEVVGEVDESAVVITSRGPSGPRFEGTLEGDSIRGIWMYMLHGDTLHSGRLLMRRVRASEYTDSALVRSRRGVDEWIHAPPLVPRQQVDTAPPAREVQPR